MSSRNIYTPKVVKCGQKWPKVAKSGQKWSKVVKCGQKWSKVAKSGQKWSNVAKSGQKWPKVAKSGQMWSEFSEDLRNPNLRLEVINYFFIFSFLFSEFFERNVSNLRSFFVIHAAQQLRGRNTGNLQDEAEHV